MRISHKYKFIFLSNPQSGSSSIRKILDKYSDIKSERNYPYHHHVDAKFLKNVFIENGWDWNNYFKFTTIRNPWDKMLSRYFYGLRNPESVWHKPALESNFENFLKNDYVLERSKLYSIDEFAYDKEGNCLLDYIIKLEDLELHLPMIQNKIGIPNEHIIRVNKAVKKRKHYSNFYSEETIRIVADIHKEDIQLSEYRYQASANKYIGIIKNILKK